MKCDICNQEKENRVLKFDNDESLALPCREYIDNQTNKFTVAVKKVKYICLDCLYKTTREMETIMLEKGYTGAFDEHNGFDAFTFYNPIKK